MLTLLGVGDNAAALPDWQALVLGLVQGATELLPISSSGHLILTAVARRLGVLEGARRLQPDVRRLAAPGHAGRGRRSTSARTSSGSPRPGCGLIRRRRIETADERIAWCVAAATVPAAVVGAVGENLIAEKLGEPWQIAILLAVFALVLYVRRPARRRRSRWGRSASRRRSRSGSRSRLSLMPGVSRSGITITAGRLLCLDRDSAARFSFLLLVPITFGAVAYKGVSDVLLADLPPGTAGPFVVGSLASFARRARRDLGAARLRAPPQLHGLRDLPARCRGDRAAADRHRRARGGLLRSYAPRSRTRPSCSSCERETGTRGVLRARCSTRRPPQRSPALLRASRWGSS